MATKMIDLRAGDCLEVLRTLPDASADSVVTDPPYGLEFMGKEWDAPWKSGTVLADAASVGGFQDGAGGNPFSRSRIRFGNDEPHAFQAWCQAWAAECLRVLKPGGHLVSFGGTRTYHRLAAGLEDAGFEIRDCLCWLYGSGFPKSLDVSKAIDAQAGVEREVVGKGENWGASTIEEGKTGYGDYAGEWALTAPATDEAKQWQGWGTALKPAFEPVVLARKPFPRTVAENVLEHGTGALNVDGCRIDTGGEVIVAGLSDPDNRRGVVGKAWQAPSDKERNQQAQRESLQRANELGRWPANVLLDEQAAAMLDEQTGELASGSRKAGEYGRLGGAGRYGAWGAGPMPAVEGDTGGASRFFYCAKVSAAERNAGLDGFEEGERQSYGTIRSNRGAGYEEASSGRNVHPTVKPIELMRWLVRLVTPPGGTVLDPFLGSGTTMIACGLEGLAGIGIERDEDYMEIARARIAFWREHGEKALAAVAAAAVREQIAETGQMDLFSGMMT